MIEVEGRKLGRVTIVLVLLLSLHRTRGYWVIDRVLETRAKEITFAVHFEIRDIAVPPSPSNGLGWREPALSAAEAGFAIESSQSPRRSLRLTMDCKSSTLDYFRMMLFPNSCNVPTQQATTVKISPDQH